MGQKREMISTPRIYPRVLRVISACLVLAFTINDFAHAAPAELFAPRMMLNPSSINFSGSFAKVSDVFQGKSPRLLIHIQDAHTNTGAEKNISQTLEELITRFHIKTVFIEGGTKDDSLDFLRPLASKEVREQVAKKYLMQGELNGAEYLSLASDHAFKILGVEEASLYEKNLKTYAAVVERREAVLSYVGQMDQRVGSLKRRIYPKELVEFDDFLRKYKNKEKSFTDYYAALSSTASRYGISLLGFPHFLSLKGLQAKEDKIDFKKANTEQAALAVLVSDKTLAAHAEKMKSGNLNPLPFYEAVLAEAHAKKINLGDYPNFSAYVDYLRDYSKIKMERLLNETRILEEVIYQKALPEEDVFYLYRLDKYLSVLKSLFSLQATPQEFDDYSLLQKDMRFNTAVCLAYINRKLYDLGNYADVVATDSILDENKKEIEDFYRVTGDRDEVFLNKSLAEMEKNNISAAVLITGGYHTPSLRQKMKERNISYAVVTPAVTEETNLVRYEKILLSRAGLEAQLPLDKKEIVSGRQDFINPTLNAEVPRTPIVSKISSEFQMLGFQPSTPNKTLNAARLAKGKITHQDASAARLSEAASSQSPTKPAKFSLKRWLLIGVISFAILQILLVNGSLYVALSIPPSGMVTDAQEVNGVRSLGPVNTIPYTSIPAPGFFVRVFKFFGGTTKGGNPVKFEYTPNGEKVTLPDGEVILIVPKNTSAPENEEVTSEALGDGARLANYTPVLGIVAVVVFIASVLQNISRKADPNYVPTPAEVIEEQAMINDIRSRALEVAGKIRHGIGDIASGSISKNDNSVKIASILFEGLDQKEKNIFFSTLIEILREVINPAHQYHEDTPRILSVLADWGRLNPENLQFLIAQLNKEENPGVAEILKTAIGAREITTKQNRELSPEERRQFGLSEKPFDPRDASKVLFNYKSGPIDNEMKEGSIFGSFPWISETEVKNTEKPEPSGAVDPSGGARLAASRTKTMKKSDTGRLQNSADAMVKDIRKMDGHLLGLAKLVQRQMGLESDNPKKSLLMIPNSIQKPNLKSLAGKRAVYADLGGSTLHMGEIEIGVDGTITVLWEKPMPLGDHVSEGGSKLFDFMAQQILQTVREKSGDLEQPKIMGFTFSFPHQNGVVIKKSSTKGFNFSDIIGQNVMELMNERLKKSSAKYGIKQLEVVAVTNDTEGAMVQGMVRFKNALVSVIAGSGFNTAVWWLNQMFNMESGGLRIRNNWLGKHDLKVMKRGAEELISGHFLGLQLRARLLDLVRNYGLFGGKVTRALRLRKGISSEIVTSIYEARSNRKIQEILSTIGITNVSNQDAQIVKEISSALVERSFKVNAGIIAGSLAKTKTTKRAQVAVDGALWKIPAYTRGVQRQLNLLLQELNLPRAQIRRVNNASGIGSAVTALVVNSQQDSAARLATKTEETNPPLTVYYVGRDDRSIQISHGVGFGTQVYYRDVPESLNLKNLNRQQAMGALVQIADALDAQLPGDKHDLRFRPSKDDSARAANKDIRQKISNVVQGLKFDIPGAARLATSPAKSVVDDKSAVLNVLQDSLATQGSRLSSESHFGGSQAELIPDTTQVAARLAAANESKISLAKRLQYPFLLLLTSLSIVTFDFAQENGQGSIAIDIQVQDADPAVSSIRLHPRQFKAAIAGELINFINTAAFEAAGNARNLLSQNVPAWSYEDAVWNPLMKAPLTNASGIQAVEVFLPATILKNVADLRQALQKASMVSKSRGVHIVINILSKEGNLTPSERTLIDKEISAIGNSRLGVDYRSVSEGQTLSEAALEKLAEQQEGLEKLKQGTTKVMLIASSSNEQEILSQIGTIDAVYRDSIFSAGADILSNEQANLGAFSLAEMMAVSLYQAMGLETMLPSILNLRSVIVSGRRLFIFTFNLNQELVLLRLARQAEIAA